MPTAVALDIRRAAKKSNHKERKDHEEVGAKTLHALLCGILLRDLCALCG
jgi:hypothetical protein